MSDEDPSVSATVAAIEAAFADRWGVWLSDTGWWWATRTQALTAEELSAGCVPFVHADNPDELKERIRQQECLSHTNHESDKEARPASPPPAARSRRKS